MEYGLIGERLGHSFSPMIHSRLGSYDYQLYSLPPQELEPLLRERKFRGLNVTIPYKQAVIPFCNGLSDTAREIGSVNTLVVDAEGKLWGHNTDQYGFLFMLRRAGIQLAGKKVLILGSGGTSLTAVSAAKQLGAAEIIVVSRKGEHNYENLHRHYDSQIILNTTPVGMFPNNGQQAIDLRLFPKCEGVADVIYNPLRTALLLDAQELGLPCTGGLPMLVAQAGRAAELFTGQKTGDETIEEIHRELLLQLTNLVLIGMPGSGKSSVGAGAAAILGREHLDTDTLLCQRSDCTIPQLFEQGGEAHFRDVEAEAVAEAGKQVGKVISTGGGAILREENYRSLRQNGVLCFVQREIAQLEQEGRPLSKDLETLRRLYERRLPLYSQYSSLTVQNHGALEETIRAAVEGFHGALQAE